MKKTSLLLATLFAAFTLSVHAKDEPKVDAKPAVEKKADATAKPADKKMEAKAKADDKKAAAAKVVDINTATADEMAALPVIGDAIAKKIIAGRPYKGKDDLVKNKVLTPKEYAKIKNKIIAKQS
ncbi:MAG: helix-hairpin-helix domain-containing protein [Burkholderiales bacterium]